MLVRRDWEEGYKPLGVIVQVGNVSGRVRYSTKYSVTLGTKSFGLSKEDTHDIYDGRLRLKGARLKGATS